MKYFQQNLKHFFKDRKATSLESTRVVLKDLYFSSVFSSTLGRPCAWSPLFSSCFSLITDSSLTAQRDAASVISQLTHDDEKEPTQTAGGMNSFPPPPAILLARSMQIHSFSFTGVSAPGEAWLRQRDSVSVARCKWPDKRPPVPFPLPDTGWHLYCSAQVAPVFFFLIYNLMNTSLRATWPTCWFRTIRSS